MKGAAIMKKFEIGKTYATSSICDTNCIFSYTVTARTACTITIVDKYGEVKKCRINKKTTEYRNAEAIYPEGVYSMAPIISADKITQ